MKTKTITSAKEYKEEYKRKRESKHINKDPEIKKRFGVFKVSELLKYEDKEHFKNLYNYTPNILDDYMLPEEKKEKEKKEKAMKERERKIKLQKEKNLYPENEEQVETKQILDNIVGNIIEDNEHNKNLKEALFVVFDPSRKHDDDNQEQEYYEKKNSKTGKEIAKMERGEQVVQFFAMYGDTTPVKFIFCEKIVYENPYRFRPYDLKIISMKQVKKLVDFYIITPSGITHVYKPKFSDENLKRDVIKSVGEFFTLSDWMYQSTLFNILMKIKYFKDYLPFKIFTIWRNYNRFKRFLRIRANLANKLFLTKPAYVEELVQANGQVCLMENVSLQEIGAKTWNFQNLQDFVDHQKRTLEAAKLTFSTRINNDVADVMKSLYYTLQRRLRKNIEINEIENNKTLQELRNKSMYHLKLEKIQRKKLIKRATLDRDSYDRFANMVDLMIVEMLYQLYKRELYNVLNELIRVRNDSNYSGIFTLYLNFNEAEVSLNPGEKDLLDHFKNLYKSITEALVDVPRVKVRFSRKDLDDDEDKRNNLLGAESQVENSETIKQNLKEVLEKSDYYKSTTDKINNRLVEEYKRAVIFSQEKMEPFKKLQIEKENTKIEDFLVEQPTIDKIGEKININTFNSVNVDSKIISSFTQRDFIMNIDSSTVKENFKSYLEHNKEAIEKHLIKCFKNSFLQINNLKRVGDDISKIKKRDVKSICETKEAITKFAPEMEKLKELCIEFKQMHELISRCKLDAANKLVIADELNQASDLYEVHVQMEKKVKDTLNEINTLKENSLIGDITETLKANKENIIRLTEEIKSDDSCLASVNSPQDQIKTELTSIEGKVKQLEQTLNTNNYYKKVLEGYNDQLKDPEMVSLWEIFDAKNTLWNSLISLQENMEIWNRNTITEIRNSEIEQKINEYEKIRQNLYSSVNNENEDKKDEVYELYQTLVSNINALSPIISAISQPCLQERHFREIFELIKLPFQGSKTLDEKTLSELKNKGIESFSSQIERIAAASIAQNEISTNMDFIEKEWSECEFGVKKHNTKDKHIICSIEKPMACIEAHSQLVQSALNSIYVNDIRDRVQKWDDDLNLIGRVIEEWLMVQRQWIYLENIFSAEDIKKQIPDAYTNFSKVNKGFIDLMQKTFDKPNVFERCKQTGLLDMLMKFNKDLDTIQKSLEEYLQTKRESFPRFYFLSNDELLKILSQTRNPRAVQDYLIKCFDGIKTISFASETSNEIISMISPENEDVKLNRELIAHENINAWLCDLEEIMLSTCYDECKKCLEGSANMGLVRKSWILEEDYICQAVITVDQIVWAQLIEKAFLDLKDNENALKEYLLIMNSQLKELADLVMIKPKGDNKNKMILGKSLLERLVIIDVHGRQVLKDLIGLGVTNKEDFEWQKNLKFYWEKESYPEGDRMDIIIKQTNSRFVFGYEYLGNPERMVITPLTDKCYITLTSAMNLNFGGAPAGPAGTGKTETTKDLGKALAVKVNVFNCTDQIDLKMMSRMFCGLAECGAWACFDEFNRIDLEVLSVIAQQVEVIQSALREKSWELVFEGKKIKLKPRFGVFITMNPGYAGRAELPDNLKSLFRPVAMMIPDYALVAQVTLLSKGFKEAEVLSIKMHQLFKLSSEQLSKQKHYDFGLRGIKSILTRAGYLKEKYFKDPENIVLIRAMKDSNLPKFLDADIELFEDIIKDLFPGVNVEKEENAMFLNKIRDTLNNNNLIHNNPNNRLVEKVNQLLDTLQVRCGNMLVGLTGVGKTTIYQTLARTLTDLGKLTEKEDSEIQPDPWFCQIIIQLLNPKSVGKNDLYMCKDEVTQTWEDGIVAKIMREAEEEEKEEGNKKISKRKWVVFDGPVDALWIEDMNTVLDDSRKLCLPDGSNIRIPLFMNLLFEVNDLKVASPATVSRCGMVYIETHHIGYLPLIDTWHLNYKKKLKAQFETDGTEKVSPKEVARFLEAIDNIYYNFKELAPKLINIIRTRCKEKIPSSNVNIIQSCINYLNCFITTEKIPLSSNIEELSKLYMAFSFFWAFGGNIEDNDRKVISKAFFTELISKKNIPLDTISSDIYDVLVDPKEICFNKWSSIPQPFKYEKTQSFFNILVPTEDTLKYKYLMNELSSHSFNSLFMGETGVGKSVIAMDFLKSLNSNSFMFKSSNFSAKTSSKNVYDLFKANIYKNGNFQPPSAKKFIYLIDDINLPQLDLYGSQQPIEFIRQLIDNRMFYDEKRMPKKIKDCVFMACCAPPSGGRNEVTPRLFRHFSMIWIPDLKHESMKTIFKEILKGYLETSLNTNNKSAASLTSELDDIMDAALEVYKRIRSEKLPTPTKSHYTFNLRDLSKVVQGMLQMNVEKLNDKQTFCNLWAHETCRQFRDRLLEQDINWFDTMLYNIYTNKFNLEKESIEINTLIFTTILDKGAKNDYRMVSDFALLNKRVKEALDKNNLNKANYMNLVFFTDATNHFCRIARILSQQRGNALLVGLGGSGRQSLTRLVGSSLNFPFVNLNIVKGYDSTAFWKDIASILVRVGTSDNQPHIFIFSDTQIIYESFLEDINNILNNGEVPNLLKDDELNLIYNSLKDIAKDVPGYNETKDSVYQFFVSRVRDNLRIALSFSPVGVNFRIRCLQFPSIINCCTIDWFNVWPEDALASVAERFLCEKEELQEEGMIDKLKAVFMKIHTKARLLSIKMENELLRHYYITPTSYLEYIKMFMIIYNEKLKDIPKQITNYKQGIKKLNEANEIVRELKEDLIKLEPQQIEKRAEVEEMVEELEKSKEQVKQESLKLKVDKDIVQSKRDEISDKKKECDAELELALPALERAKAALQGLKEGDIKQLGAYPNPSDYIVKMGKCICAIFDSKELEYSNFKSLVFNTRVFLENCTNEEYMVAKLSNPRKVKQVNEYWGVIENLEYSKISETAVGLKNWIGSILIYVSKFKEVKPKMEAVEVMKKQLIEVEAALEEKSKVLYEKEAQLKKLTKAFNDAKNELKKLEDSIETINIKSKRANRLVEGLKSEGKRWKENISILESAEKNLIANVILSASIISYSGPFPIEYRKEFLNSCKNFIVENEIFFSETDEVYSLVNNMCDPLTVREWTYSGLPADDLSIDNAIITVRTKRWPLIIDPQLQANKWIKNYYKNHNIRVYKSTFKNLFNRTKDCVTSGFPVLVENIENTIDSSMEPILQKNIYFQGSIQLLSMGADKPIQYNSNFKLFLTSKMANPHYLPELSIKVTLINFTVTQKGLEDQLLVDVVKHERPDLEAQRDNLILNINENKKLIKDLETTILNMVKDAGNDILDTDHLVNKLDQSKVQSEKISKDLEEAEMTANTINKERKAYKPIASRGSIIYFVIASLALVDTMYNYSLEYFNKLFNQRLEKSEMHANVPKRVEILIDDITLSFYEKICRGLFVRDQMLYAFLIVMNVLLQVGDEVNQIEWGFFLKGPQITYKVDEDYNIDYIKEEVYLKFLSMQECGDSFKEIKDSIINDSSVWKEYIKSEDPFNFKLPEKIESKATDFQKLVLIKTIREEMLIPSVKQFIEKKFQDQRFVKAPPFSIPNAFDDSYNTTPLIFVLSPGANPVNFLKQFAQEKNQKLLTLSLGQDQDKVAKEYIKRARQTGDWVCLENCHLYLSWMPALEEIQEEQYDGSLEIHSNFRLWLTSVPDKAFPASILQSGVKITNEPPKGIKANLSGTFQNIKDEELHMSKKPKEFKTLLFSLAFFHAVILERKKFGALGWNIPYEWMNSDFDASKLHLMRYLEEYNDIPVNILRFLIGTINYGGRVTDDKDGKLIDAILANYFNFKVFQENFSFSKDGKYYIPQYDSTKELFEYFEKMPMDDTPDIFGLHENANITLQKKLVSEFMEPMISIQPRSSGSSVRKPEDIVLDIKTSIENKFNSIQPLNLSVDSGSVYTVDSNGIKKKSSLGNFLIQEAEKFNLLLDVIKKTLKKLKDAIVGDDVMSPDLELVFDSFLLNRVPIRWENYAYLSLKPLSSWVNDLIERFIFMRNWLEVGNIKSYWVPAFFFPQGKYNYYLLFNIIF